MKKEREREGRKGKKDIGNGMKEYINACEMRMLR